MKQNQNEKTFKFSKNKKLDTTLKTILLDYYTEDSNNADENIKVLLHLLKRYYQEFKGYYYITNNCTDYNLYTYGCGRIYNNEIIDLYANYKSLKNASINKLTEIYKRQTGYIVREFLLYQTPEQQVKNIKSILKEFNYIK